MLQINIQGIEYSLANTLRVAYKVQGCNNHKPYSQVFKEVGDATLEKQIEVLFCAFQVANPNVPMKFQTFLDHYLDNYTLRDVLAQVKEVVEGIMGKDEDEDKTENSEDTESNSEGN